jgi:probable phosphoglycerate mutase
MNTEIALEKRRRLYLMRHAQVEYFDNQRRPLDPSTVRLTAHGEIQAKAAAHALAEVEFDLALCSGLPRTEQTAQIVLGPRVLELESIAELKEIRGGRLRDLGNDGLLQQVAYPYEQAHLSDARFLGGESFEDFYQRVLQAWKQLLARPWSRALLVAHDAVNRVLLGYIASNSGVSCLQAFEQDPACINVVDLDVYDGQLRRGLFRSINYTPYDPIKKYSCYTVMEQVYLDFSPSLDARSF